MSRLFRIVIFTLLIAAIVFFGFRALLSNNAFQSAQNDHNTSENDRTLSESSQGQEADTIETSKAKNNSEPVAADETSVDNDSSDSKVTGDAKEETNENTENNKDKDSQSQ